ncbi:cell division protein FtsX [Zavarzinia sp. CC-PAN008]|uniref:cell division protein FtsX n=1 Tax=Zavarzinia sp. CC-PAN008 TaxID=3243332 RepID=UPI003F743C36
MSDASLLPQDRLATRLLPAVIAVMVLLAAIAIGGLFTLNAALATWSDELGGDLTVQIPALDDASAEAEMAAALETLKQTPGIVQAAPMARPVLEALLEPWLGAGNVPPDLPLPRLIEVRIDVLNPPDMPALRKTLADRAPNARLEDPKEWLHGLVVLTRTAQFIALGVVVLVLGALVATVVLATRAGLAANESVVEVMHLVGAQDSFVAHQFERQYLVLGLKGGLAGLVLAILAYGLLVLLRGDVEAGFLPDLTPGIGQILTFLMLPVLVAALTTLSAGLTVRGQLGRLS